MNTRKHGDDVYSAWCQANYLYSRWAANHGINYYSLVILYALDTKGDITQRAICDYYGLPKQTTNTVIRSLKQQGYIILEENKEDRREKNVVLTNKGKSYSTEILEPLYRLEKKVFDDIGEERLIQMLETTKLFSILFEKNMEENE